MDNFQECARLIYIYINVEFINNKFKNGKLYTMIIENLEWKVIGSMLATSPCYRLKTKIK